MDIGRVLLALVMVPAYRVKKIITPGVSFKNIYGAVIAANHQSFSDPLIINSCFWYRRVHFVVGEAVMTGFREKLLRQTGCIKIRRGLADLDGIKKCMEVTKSGWPLAMFPEGSLESESLKGGVVLVASKTDVPIIPAYIEKRKNVFKMTRVHFGEPIYPKDYCKKSLPTKQETDEILKVLAERYQKLKES